MEKEGKKKYSDSLLTSILMSDAGFCDSKIVLGRMSYSKWRVERKIPIPKSLLS